MREMLAAAGIGSGSVFFLYLVYTYGTPLVHGWNGVA